jgi:DDE_Tnp_1-associated
MKRNTELQLEGMGSEEIVFSVDSLMAALHQITDPRKARGIRYGLVELLTLLILAKLGGEDSLKGIAEWVRLCGEQLVGGGEFRGKSVILPPQSRDAPPEVEIIWLHRRGSAR